MMRRLYLYWFLLAIGLVLAAGLFQSAPGYMDADYYYAGGLRLAQGKGFSELILWNYLDDPEGLPHPSHGYWMPLTSMVAWLGMTITGRLDFWSARIGFFLLVGLIPFITSRLALALGSTESQARLAGWLAVIPGFYLAYIGVPDAFGLYMVLGGIWLCLSGEAVRIAQANNEQKSENPGSTRPTFLRGILVSAGLGLTSGLLHLARTDGVIWIALAFGLLVIEFWPRKSRAQRKIYGAFILLSLFSALGYFVVMLPWLLRNLSVFGTPLAPGGSQAFWLTRYDEIYTYPAALLSMQRWWDSGLSAILAARWQALSQNLQTALAVQGSIFLAPLIVTGLLAKRARPEIRYGLFGWGITLLVMTLVFPFQGMRGGFFHSGAAVQTLFWAVVPIGFDRFIGWGVRYRRWNATQASSVFRVGLMGFALFLTLAVTARRVIGTDWMSHVWNQSAEEYSKFENHLASLGAQQGDVVMVNNAPGYYLVSQGPAISIPDGEVDTLLVAARRYSARFLILEANHPRGLDALYAQPGDLPGLDFLETYAGAHIFYIIPEE